VLLLFLVNKNLPAGKPCEKPADSQLYYFYLFIFFLSTSIQQEKSCKSATRTIAQNAYIKQRQVNKESFNILKD